MAEIVLGVALSYGPMLSTIPEQWTLRVPADRVAKHFFHGLTRSFQELVEHRRNERFESQISLDAMRAHHAACEQAPDRLTETFAEVKPDMAVIFGNDPMEIFLKNLVDVTGIEPATPCLQSRCSPS